MPPRAWQQPEGRLCVEHRALPGVLAAAGGSERLFQLLFGGGESSSSGSSGGGGGWAGNTWWLDSAAADRGRFSYMGGPGGSLWRRITFKLPGVQGGQAGGPGAAAPAAAEAGGSLCVTDAGGGSTVLRTPLLPYLEQLLRDNRCQIRCGACPLLGLPAPHPGSADRPGHAVVSQARGRRRAAL